MKQACVRWGTRTVAKGTVEAADIEALPNGVALSLVGTKGVAPWRVEIPIEVVRRCLAAWARSLVGSVVVGAEQALAVIDAESVMRRETMTASRALSFMRLVQGWQGLMEADHPNAKVEAEESLARWLADADGDGEIERVRELRCALGLEPDAIETSIIRDGRELMNVPHDTPDPAVRRVRN